MSIEDLFVTKIILVMGFVGDVIWGFVCDKKYFSLWICLRYYLALTLFSSEDLPEVSFKGLFGKILFSFWGLLEVSLEVLFGTENVL